MDSNEIHRISMAAGDAAEAFRELGEAVKTQLEKSEGLFRILQEVREAEEKNELIQIAKQENRDFIEKKCRKCR